MSISATTPVNPFGGLGFDGDEDEPDDLVGATLHETYVIRRVIGEGGMGRVYEAHHTRIAAKRFAIKVLRAEMMHSPEIRSRFQREAEAAASIQHPNVIGVHDFGYAADGRPYLVSDYLEGVELSNHVRQRGHLPTPLAVHIARRVCSALDAAHGKGVIHRDLKPENIFLLGALEHPDVKVLDFGLSRFTEPMAGNVVTRTGIVMGTPSYMAPEQARGESTDHRTDIYGVGVLLYVAMTGHAPFEEDSPQATVIAVMSREPQRPRTHAPWIPQPLELVIQRAMARAPAERYSSMAELDAALVPYDTMNRAEPAAGRAPLLSRVGSVSEEVEVESARIQAVLLLISAALLVLLALVTTLAGLPALLGTRSLSVTEFCLVLAAVIGTVLTPCALFLRWLRRRLWNNSVRMVELVANLRAPLLAAAASYGSLVLLGRTLDGVAAQLGNVGLAPAVSGWTGWSPILALTALVTGTAVTARRQLLQAGASGITRLAAGPVLAAGTVLVIAALLQRGMTARPSELGASPPSPEAPVAAPAPADTAAPQRTQPHASASASSAPAVPMEPVPVSAQELASAIQRGVPALRELRRRHPRDPAVLEALALAMAKESRVDASTLEVLDALFTVAPGKALEKELANVVLKGALGPGDIAARALDVMALRMGSAGADLLYDLMVTNPGLKVAARERLDLPEVIAARSPELAIAYELRVARDCADRIPLLERAARTGDSRSIAVLKLLASRTRRGCGWRKTQPCPPPCPAQAARFDKVATQIQVRLSAQERASR